MLGMQQYEKPSPNHGRERLYGHRGVLQQQLRMHTANADKAGEEAEVARVRGWDWGGSLLFRKDAWHLEALISERILSSSKLAPESESLECRLIFFQSYLQ